MVTIVVAGGRRIPLVLIFLPYFGLLQLEAIQIFSRHLITLQKVNLKVLTPRNNRIQPLNKEKRKTTTFFFKQLIQTTTTMLISNVM